MAEDKTIGINVKTNVDQTQQQFNNLRKQLRETNEEIANLDKNSDTFDKDLKNLNRTLDSLNGSYDSLSKNNTDLGATFEDVHGEIMPMMSVAGELEDRMYELARAGKQNSKEFEDLLKEVARYRKVQQDVDMVVDASAQTMEQQLGGALQGVASGFAVVQGVMGLFGTESEEVEEAMLKVQSAMAIAEGVSDLRDAAKSMGLLSKATKAQTVVQKGLNLVMKANPIALLITAVVAIIGYFAIFTDAIDTVVESLKSVSDWLGITDSEGDEMEAKRQQQAENEKQRKEQQRKQAERLHNQNMNAIDNEISIAQAQGKDTTALQKKKLNEILTIKRARLGELEVSLKDLEVQRKIVKVVAALMKLEGKEKQDFIDKRMKEIDDQVNEVEQLKKDIAKAETELKILDINAKKRSREKSKNYKTEQETKAKTDQEALDKALKKEDQQFEMLQKLRNSAREQEIHELVKSYEEQFKLAEGNAELEKALIEKQQEDIKAINKKYDDEIEAKRLEEEQKLKDQKAQELQLLNEATLDEKDLELANLELEYQEKFALAKGNAELMVALEEDLKNKKKKINDDYRKQEIADEIEMRSKQIDLASNALGAIGDLATAFADESEASQKRAFEINKAVSLGQAIMSTAQGIMNELAHPVKSLTFTNYASAAIVAMTGAAQIATIAKTKFDGGSQETPTPPGDTATASATPQFNVVGDSGINQLADLQQQPVQAFVVSGEVTTAQSLDRNKIQNATI
jgi:myosin heavy subunit